MKKNALSRMSCRSARSSRRSTAACSLSPEDPVPVKTTTINTIIRYFEQEEMEILLAAPTGRAAKRMTEATGYEAQDDTPSAGADRESPLMIKTHQACILSAMRRIRWMQMLSSLMRCPWWIFT